jgi:hypothetical protein
MKRIAALLTALLVALIGCGASATDDRKAGKGSEPDGYGDMTNVIVYRNADSVPNLALWCVGDHAFWSTLSGSDSGENKASQVIRAEDQDVPHCGRKPQ